MKQALKVIDEIKRLEDAIENTNSIYLKRYYTKQIRRLKNDLREYCYYHGFIYREIESRLQR